jgi:SAM-dependent methyltransferase
MAKHALRVRDALWNLPQRTLRRCGDIPSCSDRFAMILAALPTDAGNRALEIGVNPGLFTQALVRAGYRVSGTDLFPEHRASLWRDLGVDVRRWNIDTEPPPYPPASFDLIIFSEVIEHLVNPPLDALAAMRELLVPGGYLLISTPNQFYLKSRLRVLADILLLRPFEHDDEFRRWASLKAEARYYTHSRLYSMEQLCWMLDQAGFIVKSAYTAIHGSVSVWSGSVCCVTPIAGWSRRCSGA